MKYILTFFISLFFFLTNAQEFTKGLILPDSTITHCCVYIPKTGLKLYDSPNGTILGKLILGSPDGQNEVYTAYMYNGKDKVEFEYPNLHMIGYEIMAIIYEDQKDGFVQTFNGYWFSIKELNAKGLRLKTWMEYMTEKVSVLGWYASDIGLNLWTEPSRDSEVIARLKGDLWEITLTKETKGHWCKVIVKEYKSHPCSGEETIILQTLTGWVQVLTNDQLPYLWNYEKGC